MPGKNKILELYGSMYETNFIELSDDELQQLLDGLEDDESLEDAAPDLYDRIMDDSLINGYRVEDGKWYMKISIDGSDVPISEVGGPSETVPASDKPTLKTKLTSHFLVFEKWSTNGKMDLKISSKFDTDLFDIYEDDIQLPNGEKRVVLSVTYDGEDFEFQQSYTDHERLYILRSDGDLIDLAV
jgi:hypothetical protein